MRSGAIPLALASAWVLALSGCLGGVDLPQPPGPTPPETATAAPVTPTPPAPRASAADDAADVPDGLQPNPSLPSDLTLDCPVFESDDPDYFAIEPNRYANVCLGMSFDEASVAMPGLEVTGDPQCPWYADIVDAFPLVSSAITERDDPGESITAFRVTYSADLEGLDPWGVPRTYEGLGLGSTREDVIAAHPRAVEVTLQDPTRGPRTQVVVPHESGLAYVFDVADGVVTEMTWGAGLASGVTGDFCAG